MSRETSHWLNTMTLIGDTDRRGKAWHYRADLQGDTGNHFPGAIPIERIGELFDPYEPVLRPLYVGVEDDDGEETERLLLPGHFAIVPVTRPNDVLNVVSESYKIHNYTEWLTNTLSNLVDGEVHFSSAGLLQRGGVAWVEMSTSANMFAADFEFKPQILASTSVNGKYSTSIGGTVQAVVCDNTLAVAASEGGKIKVKHSKYSTLKLQSARDALGIIVGTGEAMVAEIERLAAQKVSGKEWNLVLDEFVPMKDKDGDPLEGASLTKAEQIRQAYGDLWAHDPRVAPWRGTGLGVLQAFNTYDHHVKPVRNTLGGTTDRAHRNMVSAIDGSLSRSTAAVFDAMNKVLQTV